MKKLDLVKQFCDGERTAKEVSLLAGCSLSYAKSSMTSLDLPRRKRGGMAGRRNTRDKRNDYKVDEIRHLCDGHTTSKMIHNILGYDQKYIQNIMKKYDLPRMPQGGPVGSLNGSYTFGRSIDLDGYALVSAPENHPYARKLPGKNVGRILEHRLVVEKYIRRFLLPHEVVDHINGLHLHNDFSNLRVFENNKNHLVSTISSNVPIWSTAGIEKMKIAPALRSNFPRVDIYHQRKVSGDIRTHQILLAWLQFDKDSPHLLGTTVHLDKIQVDYSSRSGIISALDDLYQKWEQAH